MNIVTILWIYIVLLVIGGLIGFLKGKSKISLILSVAFGIALTLCVLRVLPFAWHTWILIALLVVFAVRLIQTRKFMPSGLMLILTILALGLPRIL